MVTADLVLELGLVLTIFLVILAMIPRMRVGNRETLAGLHRRQVISDKRRQAHVRSMPPHAGLRHVRHAA